MSVAEQSVVIYLKDLVSLKDVTLKDKLCLFISIDTFTFESVVKLAV